MLLSHLVVLLAVQLPAIDAAYRLETEPASRVRATMTFEVRCDKIDAKEWILFAASLPTTPGQSDVATRMVPAAEQIHELSHLKRSVLQARIDAAKDELKHRVQTTVTCEATLWARRLVPVGAGERRPRVAALAPAERAAALRSVGDLDYDGKEFLNWQRKEGLVRDIGEGDIAYARRTFQAIRTNYRYEFHPEQDRTPSGVCLAGKSDCGGLSNLFVATLRSQGIPARTLAGRWAVSADPNQKLNGHPYFQYHIKAEFYAPGVGWVPVDMASGILHDRSREGLHYFGNDPGDFLVQHIDGNLEVDTLIFGRQSLPTLQRPSYWVTGSGTLDDLHVTESWTVSQVP